MDRADRTGLGIAVVAHAALFAALSLNLLKPPALPKIDTDPIDVSIVDAVALESASPDPTPAASAPAPAPAPVEETAPTPEEFTPPPPQPVAKPQPAPKPIAKPVPPKTQPKPTKATPQTTPPKRTGLSRDLVAGLQDSPTPSKRPNPSQQAGSGTPAKTISPPVASSIGAEIRRQLKPHWKSPTGADVELLRTTLIVRLNRDGSIDGAPALDSQTGVNESNRTQAKLHADQAIKAVRLAAPFQLPVEYYEAWKVIRPTFDKRLSQ